MPWPYLLTTLSAVGLLAEALEPCRISRWVPTLVVWSACICSPRPIRVGGERKSPPPSHCSVLWCSCAGGTLTTRHRWSFSTGGFFAAPSVTRSTHETVDSQTCNLHRTPCSGNGSSESPPLLLPTGRVPHTRARSCVTLTSRKKKYHGAHYSNPEPARSGA